MQPTGSRSWIQRIMVHGRLGPVLGPQQSVVEHMRAVPHGEVAGAIRKMRDSGATPPVKLAFEFLVLTARALIPFLRFARSAS